MFKIINTALAEGIVPCGPGTSVPKCGQEQFFELIYKVINFGLDTAALLAVIFIIWGGILMLTAGGSEDKINQGKKSATAAIVGLFLVLISWLIVNTIITWFTDCKGNWGVFGGLSC